MRYIFVILIVALTNKLVGQSLVKKYNSFKAENVSGSMLLTINNELNNSGPELSEYVSKFKLPADFDTKGVNKFRSGIIEMQKEHQDLESGMQSYR